MVDLQRFQEGSVSELRYQCSVVHYLGLNNPEERGVCERFVVELCTRVESKYGKGVSIFTDWESKVGQNILDVLSDLGQSSKCLVVLFSPSFIADPFHLDYLKCVLKTLVEQRRLVAVEILGVTLKDYDSQLGRFNSITPITFHNNWADIEDSWAKLLYTVCNINFPILWQINPPRAVFQSATQNIGLLPGFGIIMASDGKLGTDTIAFRKKELYYKVLMSHAVLITDTIEVTDFSSYLIQGDVFDIDGLAEITCERTRLRRANQFLEELKKKSAEQIKRAVESMRRSYNHVYTPLIQALQDVDRKMAEEDTASFQSSCSYSHPVEETQGHLASQGTGTAMLVQTGHCQPTEPSGQPSLEATHSYNASLQPQSWLPDAMDHADHSSNIEVITAKIARLEALKATIPNRMSPNERHGHPHPQAVQYSQPPQTQQHNQPTKNTASRPPLDLPNHQILTIPISQDDLPFSPTDNIEYERQLKKRPGIRHQELSGAIAAGISEQHGVHPESEFSLPSSVPASIGEIPGMHMEQTSPKTFIQGLESDTDLGSALSLPSNSAGRLVTMCNPSNENEQSYPTTTGAKQPLETGIASLNLREDPVDSASGDAVAYLSDVSLETFSSGRNK